MSETMDEFERYFGPGTREERAARAARLDGEAMADNAKFSNAETELAELLTDVLGHQPAAPGQHARWLLHKCLGDYRGLRKLITARRIGGELEWVQLKRKNAYSLRSWLAEEYVKEQQGEEKRRRANTSEGRRARYVTEGVLS